MKKGLMLIVAASLMLCGFTVGVTRADILNELGITEKEAQRCIWSSFEKSRMYIPPGITSRRVSLKSLAFQSCRELIKEFGKYIKEYVSSEAFSRQYDEFRATKAPAAPSKPNDGLKRIEEENRKN